MVNYTTTVEAAPQHPAAIAGPAFASQEMSVLQQMVPAPMKKRVLVEIQFVHRIDVVMPL